MTISECEARFHDLSRHATIIVPTDQKRVCCFVRGLRLHLRIETESKVSPGLSFLDVVGLYHGKALARSNGKAKRGLSRGQL